MELKNYQKKTMSDLASYLSYLNTILDMAKAYQTHWLAQDVRVGFGGVPNYRNTIPGTPHVCFNSTNGCRQDLLCLCIGEQILMPCRKNKLRVQSGVGSFRPTRLLRTNYLYPYPM